MKRHALEARIAELRQRRELLTERADAQRLELAAICTEFERPLRWARAGMRVVAFLRSSPAFAAFSTAAGVLVGPRLASVRTWLPRGVMLYKLVNAVKHKWREHKSTETPQVDVAT